jgi:hypothetical protein
MSEDFRRIPIGIPICREHDYDAFRAIFEDAHNLPGTWQEFMEIAQEHEEFYKEQGNRVVRVYIDPHTFPDWCAQRGRRVDARARHAFAAQAAQAQRGD